MLVYFIIRVCYQNGSKKLGPSIALFFTQEKAQKELRRWKGEHSWDKTHYTVKSMETMDNTIEVNPPIIFVVTRICEQLDEARNGSLCGSPICAFCNREKAKEKIREYKENYSWENNNFIIRPMRVCGNRRKNSR